MSYYTSSTTTNTIILGNGIISSGPQYQALMNQQAQSTNTSGSYYNSYNEASLYRDYYEAALTEIAQLRDQIYILTNSRERDNQYVAASDVLEEFMRWCAAEGHLTKHEFGELPIRLLFQYLIVRAAENDNEPCEDERRALAHLTSTHSRCGYCGRFTVRGMPYCDNAHAGAARGRQRSIACAPVG